MKTTSNAVTEVVFKNELTEKGLEDLRKKFPAGLVVDMSNDAEFKAGRKIRTERNKLIDAINRRRLDVTKELKDHGDNLINEVTENYGVNVGPFEIEDTRRKEVEKEKQRKLDALLEKQRAEIAGIEQFLIDANTASSEEISGMVDAVGNIEPDMFHKDLIHEAMEMIKKVKISLADVLVKQIEAERLEEENRVAEEARKAAEAEAERVKKEADDKAEEVRLETEARENAAQQVQQVTERITNLKMIPMDVMGEPADVIGRKINSIVRVEITEEGFGDRYQEAIDAKDTVLEQLNKMLAQAEQLEALTVKEEPITQEEAVQPEAKPEDIKGVTTGADLANNTSHHASDERPSKPEKLEVNNSVIGEFLKGQLYDVTDFGYLLVSDDPQHNAEAVANLRAKFQVFIGNK